MSKEALAVVATVVLGAISACTSGPQDRTELERLEGRLQALEERVREAETSLQSLRRSERAVDPPSDGAAVSPDFQGIVERLLAAREERQRQEREAERERQITEMVARSNQQMVDRLTQSLTLTNDQQVKVKAVIEEYSAKRREVITRAGEALRNGQEFDRVGELGKVTTAATDAVRNELSSAQLKTFNELVGDLGLAALEQRRGMGTEGFGGAPGAAPGGNR